MRKSIVSRGIVASIAALAVSGVAAGAASAAPATFNLSGSATPTESAALTFKVGTSPTAAQTFTCAAGSIYSQSAGTGNYGSPLVGLLNIELHGVCTSGTGVSTFVDVYNTPGLWWAQKVGSVYSLAATQTLQMRIAAGSSIYISAANQASTYTVGWTNGTSVASPSTANFSNTAIGKASSGSTGLIGQPMTLSGSIKLTSGGSLLTLN